MEEGHDKRGRNPSRVIPRHEISKWGIGQKRYSLSTTNINDRYRGRAVMYNRGQEACGGRRVELIGEIDVFRTGYDGRC